MSKIDEAELLMKEGRTEAADILLKTLIQEKPTDSDAHQNAIYIYMIGRMFKEARKVHAHYKERTGKVIKDRSTIEEIEQEEKKYLHAVEMFKNTEPKIFKRKSPYSYTLKELFGAFCPRDLQIYKDRLVLSGRSKKYTYRWPEITNAMIKKQTIATHLMGDCIKKTLFLKTQDRTYQFDVSDLYLSGGA